jgi:hypothetical protein
MNCEEMGQDGGTEMGAWRGRTRCGEGDRDCGLKEGMRTGAHPIGATAREGTRTARCATWAGRRLFHDGVMCVILIVGLILLGLGAGLPGL